MDFIKVLDFLVHTLGAEKVFPLLIVLFVGDGVEISIQTRF